MTHVKIWHDKVAIITGGSSGIGAETALVLADAGAHVLITGRTKETLADIARQSPRIETIVADSKEPQSAAHIVDQAVTQWGKIDLLVNNSGAGGVAFIPDYDWTTIAEVNAVNIAAPSLLVKEAAEHLKKTSGAIVNVTTAASRGASPITAHYAATKLALEHLTLSWAIELAPYNIRVNAVAPGPVATNALSGMMGLSPEQAAAVEQEELRQTPLGRRGLPSDIARWIIELGQPGDNWMTGQVITVDGGWASRIAP